MARSVKGWAKPFGVLTDASWLLAGYVSRAMANRFGVLLHPDDVRWAAAEGVSETIIAAVLLLHERSVDEIASQLSAAELEQVITLVGRSPRLYASGTLGALKQRRSLPAPTPSVGSPKVTGTGPAARHSLAERAKRLGAPSPPRDPRAAPRPAAPTREPPKRSNASPKLNGFRGPPGRESSGQAAKSGTLSGTAAETARRRLIVEDLVKAGLTSCWSPHRASRGDGDA
jgi:hypothetical protein